MRRVLSVAAAAAAVVTAFVMAAGAPAVVGASAAGAVAVTDAAPAAAAVAAPAPSETHLVSASPGGAAGDKWADREVSVSGDGRYVAFASSATNIGDVRGTGSTSQVFVRDVVAGTTQTISAASGQPGNGNSTAPSISADGSTVAYVSGATNLVSAARSGIAQVFVWSRATGQAQLASVSSDAVPVAANKASYEVDISGDGTTVVFTSSATNLTSENTWNFAQLYHRDLVANVTTMVSVNQAVAGQGAGADVSSPSLSDGGKVAFTTRAALTGRPVNGFSQLYLRHLAAGTTSLVSLKNGSAEPANESTSAPSLSADGGTLVFCSNATDLLEGTTRSGQLYVLEGRSGSLRLGSHDVSRTRASAGGCYDTAVSDDGRTLAFTSTANDLVPEGWTASAKSQAYVSDGPARRWRLATRPHAGPGLSSGSTFGLALSADGLRLSFASQASDLLAEPVPVGTQVYLRNLQQSPAVERIGGTDRFAVSAAVSTDAFATGVPVVYVASGAVFPDALSGSAAAGAGHGPVLLVTRDGVPADVDAELKRLRPQRIVVLGGPNSVGAGVEAALHDYSPSVTRVGGADRFDVSAAVSASAFLLPGSGFTEKPTVFVASGEVFPDALSGSAIAGAFGAPVLLVQKGAVPASVASELARLQPAKIFVLGGVNTVSEAVATELGRFAPVARVGGADRFAVSAAASATGFTEGARTVYVASGGVFPDALSGSAAAIQNEAPVLLVTKDAIPAVVATELERLDPTRIVVLGGANTVSDDVLQALERYLYHPV
jgi:putative cell wall-binding protein/Tol biopolymer transport system component